ncbi:hypothetical protein V6N11_083038 [Hibiscus sabdariffa]|uniref:Uncharacterized protein n=1 Tax=Hibiscus sabdariffa TaxID=183260 RepID=A0ABR2QL09_9ROSI
MHNTSLSTGNHMDNYCNWENGSTIWEKDVKGSGSEVEESSTDSSEDGDRRKKSISQVDSIVGDGEVELAGCLPDEAVNSTVPSHYIEETQAKGLESQIPEDPCSKRAEKDLSKLGFPLNDFFQSEFQDGRDLGSNSSREDVVLGSKNIKDSWAKVVDNKVNEDLSVDFDGSINESLMDIQSFLEVEVFHFGFEDFYLSLVSCGCFSLGQYQDMFFLQEKLKKCTEWFLLKRFQEDCELVSVEPSSLGLAIINRILIVLQGFHT